MTGAKKPLLDEEICTQFFKDYEPDACIKNLMFDKKRTATLIETQSPRQFFLIRTFGGKLVHQPLQTTQINSLNGNILTIARQGISNPPMNFSFDVAEDAMHWHGLLKNGVENGVT